jgi:hypothetical protein
MIDQTPPASERVGRELVSERAAVEGIWHTQDSQGQIMAVAFG